eukprot:CAMPEP_0197844136 /NCGR_PEP_ID=MMETSP1438-20131217/1124_1 /TAXON_ID=1461541 /ORGANISM="Pterosperma sp., Strain CCMP1384" /LENGTH=36 /DNA_ID= /DNA_START= /DNA_END= /DNA_ORIENTATION=
MTLIKWRYRSAHDPMRIMTVLMGGIIQESRSERRKD